MRALIKQTVLIFLLLLAMVTVSAGILFAIVKFGGYDRAEETARLAVDLIAASSTPAAASSSAVAAGEVPVIYETETSPTDKQEDPAAALLPAAKPISQSIPASVEPIGVEGPVARDVVLLAVPFTSQAPYGDWSDPRQDAGCEEASLLMAVHWITGEKLTPDIALKQITAMADYQLEHYGHFHDSSVADTLKLFNDYFGYHNAFVEYGIDGTDIRAQLDLGRVVIIPVNGMILSNPYFTPPGPPVHQLIVIGYDDAKQQFITHDPGTRRGANFRYSYKNLTAAMGDYLTGYNEPVTSRPPAMLVIEKEQ